MDKYVLSLTMDTAAGGIANSLVSYSKALALIHVRHKVVIPAGAAAIKELELLDNVDIHTCPRWLLKLLVVTRFTLSPRLKSLFTNAIKIFLHNARLVKHQFYPDKTMVICHSGKPRHLQLASNIIFLTETARQRFKQSNPKLTTSSNQYVIGHGFKIKDMTVSARPTDRDTIIVAGGRFVEKKRFGDLIEAARILEDKQLPFQVYIYGQGPLETSLRELIAQHKLQRVHLMPWNNKLSDTFMESDVFCLTSDVEPFGLVLGEAMLSELPVVATNTDGPLAILGDKDSESRGGYIYPAGNVEELAAILARLCKDPVLRKTLGQRARQNIRENFSIEKLAANLQALM